MFTTLARDIRVYKFENAPELLTLAQSLSGYYKFGRTNYGGQGRQTRIINLSHTEVGGSEELSSLITRSLNPMVKSYCSDFGYGKLIPETAWLIMKYEPRDYFDLHVDELPDVDRQVSVVAYLNDGYTGGMVNFPELNVTHRPSQGDVLIFPSSSGYKHSVSKVISGERYCLANWYGVGSRQPL